MRTTPVSGYALVEEQGGADWIPACPYCEDARVVDGAPCLDCCLDQSQ